MSEGSVMVDEGTGIPSTEESEETSTEESTEEEVKKESETEEDDSSSSTEEEGEDQEVTEKGTKLDKDPKSAVHQKLANAERQVKQMTQVLTNPELFRKYAEENGMTLKEAKAEIKEEIEDEKDSIEEFKPEQFKTSEDVAKALNSVRSSAQKEIKALRDENKNLREGLTGISGERKSERINKFVTDGIAAVREKYPQLNPKSDDFDKELEGEIGALYEELDFDPRTKSFRGNVSLVKLTDRVMKAAGKAGKKASKKAQTDVKVKQAGKVTSGKGKSTGTTESDDPGTAIGQKIARTLGNIK